MNPSGRSILSFPLPELFPDDMSYVILLNIAVLVQDITSHSRRFRHLGTSLHCIHTALYMHCASICGRSFTQRALGFCGKEVLLTALCS